MRDLTLNGEFPKACFSSLQLSCMDEVRDQFTRIVRKHHIIEYEREYAPSELQYAPLSRMALSSVTLGTSMLIEAQAVDDTCLVFCALDEPFNMNIDRRSIQVNNGNCGIVMPGTSFKLKAPAHASSIMLDIDLDYLESIISREANIDMKAAIDFYADNAAENNDTGLIELLKLLFNQIKRGAPEVYHRAYLARLEKLVATTLIYGRRHNYSEILQRTGTETAPRFVERAVEYMRSHAEETINLQLLARIASTSERSLARGFRKYRNSSPMAYLRAIRLQRAHEDLVRGCPEETSVTAVANKWRFYNPGRFATAYRERFGENPAMTLKKRRHPPS